MQRMLALGLMIGLALVLGGCSGGDGVPSPTPTIGAISTPQPAATPGESQGRTYTVQPGDTLWSIAQEVYGNGNLYTKIFEANRDQLTSPDEIQVGMVLKIPEL